MVHRSDQRLHIGLLLTAIAILICSGIQPRDRLTWWLEVAPAIIGAIVLVATYRRFQFSNLAYTLIWIHAVILVVGGHWTYAEMPVFNWLRDCCHWQRNYYDRLGHFAQGFVPAILTRELLLRTSALSRGKWLIVLPIAAALAISAAYELFEWAMALLLGQSADQFLGTQGDPWDTQWDMFTALVGAITAMLFVPRLHDKSIQRRVGIPPSAR